VTDAIKRNLLADMRDLCNLMLQRSTPSTSAASTHTRNASLVKGIEAVLALSREIGTHAWHSVCLSPVSTGLGKSQARGDIITMAINWRGVMANDKVSASIVRAPNAIAPVSSVVG
jgi:hypothetical protein